MAMQSLLPAGDFRATYAADTVIFPTITGRSFAIAGVCLLCCRAARRSAHTG